MPCQAKTKTGKPCKRRCTGPYCPTHANQNGEGLIDDAKIAVEKAFNPITRRIQAVREGPATKPTGRLDKFLDKTKGLRVVKMELARQPVKDAVQAAMDVLSLGKFSKTKKELNYDSTWHNYTIFTLSDGSRWKIEKNAVVEAKPATPDDWSAASNVWEIPLKGKDLTLRGMIDTAAQGHEESFWKYRAGSNNCQAWTRAVIERNGLVPDDVKVEALKLQDAGKLTDSLPAATRQIPNLLTDIAATADRVIHGDGVGFKPSQRAQIRKILFGTRN